MFFAGILTLEKNDQMLHVYNHYSNTSKREKNMLIKSKYYKYVAKKDPNRSQ